MRAPLLLAAAVLCLAACKNNDQADGTQNSDENLSAESIVSNDVTAIDAVTGDQANMAADVDMNYGNIDEGSADAALNEAAPKPHATPPRKAPKPAASAPAATPPAAATNAE